MLLVVFHLEQRGDVVVFVVAEGPPDQHLFVQLDDGVGEGFGERFEQIRVGHVLVAVQVHAVDHDAGDVLEEVGGHFQGEHDRDREPVEHVVNGGGGERPAEGLPVGGLGHADDRVGHRSADVRAEDHGDGGTDADPGRHQRDDDGGGRGRGLNEDGDQDADHDPDDGVGEQLRVREERREVLAAEQPKRIREEGQ